MEIKEAFVGEIYFQFCIKKGDKMKVIKSLIRMVYEFLAPPLKKVFGWPKL